MASIGRLNTPRSPGGNAFGSEWDSDEEGTEYNEDENIFVNENLDTSADHINVTSFLYTLFASNWCITVDIHSIQYMMQFLASLDMYAFGYKWLCSISYVTHLERR